MTSTQDLPSPSSQHEAVTGYERINYSELIQEMFRAGEVTSGDLSSSQPLSRHESTHSADGSARSCELTSSGGRDSPETEIF